MSTHLYAQKKRVELALPKHDSSYMIYKKRKDTVVEAKDLGDVFNSIFRPNKPKVAKADTVTTKPTFSVIPAIGYTLETQFVVSVTGNVAFRTDSEAKISTISANIGYSQNKQFTFPIQSEIWLKGNAFSLIGDYRFYKYPQST